LIAEHEATRVNPSFLELPGDIVERVDPVFFSDPMTAAMKALGMT
jgi:ATP-dependent Lon protease